jgi:hypothetical protein
MNDPRDVSDTFAWRPLGAIEDIDSRVLDVVKRLSPPPLQLPALSPEIKTVFATTLPFSPIAVSVTANGRLRCVGGIYAYQRAKHLLGPEDGVVTIQMPRRVATALLQRQVIAEFLLHPWWERDKRAVVRIWHAALQAFPHLVRELGLGRQRDIAAALAISTRTIRNYCRDVV